MLIPILMLITIHLKRLDEGVEQLSDWLALCQQLHLIRMKMVNDQWSWPSSYLMLNNDDQQQLLDQINLHRYDDRKSDWKPSTKQGYNDDDKENLQRNCKKMKEPKVEMRQTSLIALKSLSIEIEAPPAPIWKDKGWSWWFVVKNRPAPWWCLGRSRSQWWSQSCSRGLWHTRGAQKQQTWRRTRKRRRRWRQGSWSQGTLCTAQAGWWQLIYVLLSIKLICDAADIYLIIKSHCE